MVTSTPQLKRAIKEYQQENKRYREKIKDMQREIKYNQNAIAQCRRIILENKR